MRPRFDGFIPPSSTWASSCHAWLAGEATRASLDRCLHETYARASAGRSALTRTGDPTMTDKALEDVTILDFSHLLQGPFATQLLADMGANVIKVERAGAGRHVPHHDLLRPMGRRLGEPELPRLEPQQAVDRAQPEGAGGPGHPHRIGEKADVVVQNFRPGVLARLGYGYEDFKAVNPRIIYCSGSGYGESGPYVDRPGQDMLIQGLAGLIANTGRGDEAPVPVGAGLADQIGAMNMVYGILSALY